MAQRPGFRPSAWVIYLSSPSTPSAFVPGADRAAAWYCVSGSIVPQGTGGCLNVGSCERWRQKADFSAHTLIKHSCLQCLHNACVHWTRPYSKVSSLSHRRLAASGSGSSLAKLQGVFFTGSLLWGGYLGPFKMLMTLIFRSSGVLLSELRSSWVRGGRAVMKTKQKKKNRPSAPLPSFY